MKIKRIKELVELLNHYRNAYYNNQVSEISDFEYDQLFDELLALERETGFIMAVSPTQTVGYEVKSELVKVKHNHPMLSLDKTKDVNDVIKFFDGKQGVAMAKMDGLTCSLKYLNGELVSAETRGDGATGEDILHCVKTIKNTPLRINCKDEVIIDGEVIISYYDFEKINEILPENEKYKHPRNLASGSVRQLDSRIAAQRNMQFIAWKLVKGSNSNSFWDRISFMKELGFCTVVTVLIPSLQEFKDKYGSKEDYPHMFNGVIDTIKNMSGELAYPIDGCVFGYNDVAYGESLGATGHHLRNQLAYKFYDELYETKLVDIEWTMGKTNTLTPTAIFETVNIDGTDVSKASLHNISIIKKLGLTNNCTVRVYKANQIIPQIDSCLNDGYSEIKIPKHCPVCGGETTVVKENESEVLICTNPNCSGKLLGRLKFFVSKPAMNIEGLSEATLEVLINKEWIKSFKDIYYLYEHGREWGQLDGFGEKSVAKILDAIDRSRNVKLENFICALSIDGIGSSASKTISSHFNGDFEAFFRALMTNYQWSSLTDFGEITARNIADFGLKNATEIRELANEFTFILPEKIEIKENPFMNKAICVTGKLEHFTRDSINAKILELGAKVASGVSAKTDYLITNTPDSGSSKNVNAKKFGTKIITEKNFLEMIGE